MGQNISLLCRRPDGGTGKWERLQADEEPETGQNNSLNSRDTEQPQGSGVGQGVLNVNYDSDHDSKSDSTSSWEEVTLEDDTGNEGKSGASKYSSIKSQSDKKTTRRRKRHSRAGPSSSSSPAVNTKKSTPMALRHDSVSGIGSEQQLDGDLSSQAGQSKSCTYRPGNLPAVITDSKPLKDAGRLLSVLSEHVDSDHDLEGPESGDAVRRIIQHDIGRERTVNTRLRELKDIESRKSERRLSVTAAASMSLNVIPEIIGEEPVDPGDFKYSDTNLYF